MTARTFFVDIYEGPHVGWESCNPLDRDLNEKGITEKEARERVAGERRPWRLYQKVNGAIVACWEGGQSVDDADHGAWIASVSY